MLRLAALAIFAAVSVSRGPEAPQGALEESFRWRSIGPCNMGGRITDLAVVESKPQVIYVAAATGGVWKTSTLGMSWTPIFDGYGSASIGDIAVDPADPDVLWVGTGEANARNSVTHGDGVYKTTDGGKTFRHLGLRGTRHIGRVAIHPRDSKTVFVAALGGVYGPSRERGLFRTVDGGETWKCVKFIDEDTGFIDVAIDPEKPEIVYAAAYAVRRDGFTSSASPSRFTTAAGLYKSYDGGETWKRLAAGLPSIGVGRGGIDIWRKDSRIVYAILETSQTSQALGGGGGGGVGASLGIQAEEQDAGLTITAVTEGGPAKQAGIQVGDVLREFGGKKVESLQALLTELRGRRPGDKVQVKVLREGEEKALEVTLAGRREEDRGEEIAFQDAAGRGGVFRSDDRGETWVHVSATNPRPFYYSQVRIDPRDQNRIYVLGISLHVSSDAGRTFTTERSATGVHPDHHALWVNPNDSDHLLLGNDGGLYLSWDRGRTWEHLNNFPIGQFYAVGLDMRRPYWAYGGLQDNGSWGGPTRTGDGPITNDHWRRIGGGDGFYCRVDPADPDTVYCESQYGRATRLDLKAGGRGGRSIAPRGQGLRFEWNTPIELSPRDPRRVYIGAQKLFESPDRGDTWKELSGDLTKTAQGSISVIGPSPVDDDVIWVGTSDGAVQLTRDRGKTWQAIAIPDMPELRWVSRVEPSRRGAGTAYVSFDGRRKDDLRPWAWKTEDFGKTWLSVARGLPDNETVHVIREDPKNPDLLFAGTERSVYVSLSAGRKWVKLGRGLPVVPVHDLAVHPREGELVAATHGRSLWVTDIRPLQETDVTVLLSRAHLFEPGEFALPAAGGRSTWFGGNVRTFRGENPPPGTTIGYYLSRPANEISLEVADKEGKRVASVKPENAAGLNLVRWDPGSGGAAGGDPRRPGPGGRPPGPGGPRQRLAPGEYTVTLTVDGEKQSRKLRVVAEASTN